MCSFIEFQVIVTSIAIDKILFQFYVPTGNIGLYTSGHFI